MRIFIAMLVLLSADLCYAKESPACHPVKDPKRVICNTEVRYSGTRGTKNIVIPLKPVGEGQELSGSASSVLESFDKPISINVTISYETHGQNRTCDLQQFIKGDVSILGYKTTVGRKTSLKIDNGFGSWFFELDMSCVIE